MSTIITSKLSPNASDFQQNRAAMQEMVDDLYVHLRKVAQGGSERLRVVPRRSARLSEAQIGSHMLR